MQQRQKPGHTRMIGGRRFSLYFSRNCARRRRAARLRLRFFQHRGAGKDTVPSHSQHGTHRFFTNYFKEFAPPAVVGFEMRNQL